LPHYLSNASLKVYGAKPFRGTCIRAYINPAINKADNGAFSGSEVIGVR
jgi:hypothetical protein